MDYITVKFKIPHDKAEDFLKDLKEIVNPTPPDDNLIIYDTKQAASILNIDESKVRRLIRNKKLQATKSGRGYLITKQNLRDYARV